MNEPIERDYLGYALDYPERLAELDAARELVAETTREKMRLDAALAEAKVNRFEIGRASCRERVLRLV